MTTKYKIFVQPMGEGMPMLYGKCETDMELDHEMRKIGHHYTTQQAEAFRKDMNSDSRIPGKYWCKFTVKQVA